MMVNSVAGERALWFCQQVLSGWVDLSSYGGDWVEFLRAGGLGNESEWIELSDPSDPLAFPWEV